MLDETITTSKEIHKRTGKTFYYATRLLPERIRRATYVLYGFFRVADEVVDQADALPAEEQHERLEDFRAKALGDREADDEQGGDHVGTVRRWAQKLSPPRGPGGRTITLCPPDNEGNEWTPTRLDANSMRS